MGTTTSLPTNTKTSVNHAGLSETDAWAIATTWIDHLDVSLVCDHDGPVTSIVEHYAWVYIRGSLATDHSAAVARYATLTWQSLSCCAGFGVDENPAFWRRVFNTYAHHKRANGSGFAPIEAADISDAVRFSPRNAVSPNTTIFPRLMVDVIGLHVPSRQGDATVERVLALCRARDVHCDETVSATFDRFMTMLAPFQDAYRSARSIDVRLDVVLPPPGQLELALHRLRRIQTSLASAMPSPCCLVRQIRFKGTLVAHSATEIDLLDAFLRDVPCPLGSLWVAPPLAVSTAAISHFFRAVGTVNRPPSARSHAIAIDQSNWSDRAYAAFFSALPFTTSISSLRLSVRGTYAKPAELHDLPWLAYAMFHPNTPQSSWRHLELLDLTSRARVLDVFHHMVRGNNLLALLVGALPTCQAYHSSVLPHGTEIKLQPRDDAETLVMVDDETMTVDLCVESADSSKWREWIAVIVAGFGIGWIRSYAVHEVVTRGSSVCSLTGLYVTYNWQNHNTNGYPVGDLVHLLRVVGVHLTYLKMDAFGEAHTSTLHLILAQLCPQLKTLVCTNDGTLWSSASEIASLLSHVRLHELEIRLPLDANSLDRPSDCALKTWLQNLEALRIAVPTSTTRRSLFSRSRDSMRHVVTKLTSLQYIHWEAPLQSLRTGGVLPQPEAEASVEAPTPYDKTRAVTLCALESLKLPSRVRMYTDGAITLRCKLALLSVAKHVAIRTMDRMDENVFATIFAFATTAVPREWCIEQA